MTSPKHSSGFTLVELMIVVAVIAIIAAVAYPNYSNYIVNSRRAAAAVCLIEASQFMERTYTTEMAYDRRRDGGAVTLPALACETEIADHYDIALAASTARTYSLTATPQGTQETKDSTCGTLTLNQAGTRTASKNADATKCF